MAAGHSKQPQPVAHLGMAEASARSVPVLGAAGRCRAEQSPPGSVAVPARLRAARTGSAGNRRARMALAQLPSRESLFPLAFLSDWLFPSVTLPHLSAGDRHPSTVSTRSSRRAGGSRSRRRGARPLARSAAAGARVPARAPADPHPRGPSASPGVPAPPPAPPAASVPCASLLVPQPGQALDILLDFQGRKSQSVLIS